MDERGEVRGEGVERIERTRYCLNLLVAGKHDYGYEEEKKSISHHFLSYHTLHEEETTGDGILTSIPRSRKMRRANRIRSSFARWEDDVRDELAIEV